MPGPTSSSLTPRPPVPTLLNYHIREQLGVGGTSTVYRALHHTTHSLAAIKIVPLILSSEEDQKRAKVVVREMRIHETLRGSDMVLRLWGGEFRQRVREFPEGLWMVLDLAQGGDLFDKITPDLGLPEDIAHLYFHQLIQGLKYLAHQGICHRDIKPENCLLDENGNLKISDFGLATVFKYKGQSRLLRDRCGSPPYAAPELALPHPYAGEPVDIWSAGILLFTLLVGNTPWDQPTQASPEFSAYLRGELVRYDPWDKIGEGALQLLLTLLQPDPNRRATIAQIECDGWFVQPNPLLLPDSGLCANGTDVCRRMARSLHQHGFLGAPSGAFEEVTNDPTPMRFSQRGLDPNASFRSSLQLYSKLSMAPTQRTNPNLTRFFTTLPLPTLLSHLSTALSALQPPIGFQVQPEPEGIFLARVKLVGLDKRGERLEGSVNVSEGALPEGDLMEVDDEEDEAEGGAGGGGGTKGLDVVLWKKVADPLELKRLWMRILEGLPREVVFAT